MKGRGVKPRSFGCSREGPPHIIVKFLFLFVIYSSFASKSSLITSTNLLPYLSAPCIFFQHPSSLHVRVVSITTPSLHLRAYNLALFRTASSLPLAIFNSVTSCSVCYSTVSVFYCYQATKRRTGNVCKSTKT